MTDDYLNQEPVKEVSTRADETFTSGRRFAQLAADLQDSEIQNAVVLINSIREKYRGLPSTPNNLDHLKDEIEYKLAEQGILAKLDPTPVTEGKPPVIEIIGKISFGSFSQIPFDHERKQYEVQSAMKRGEYRWGEREPLNPKSKAAKKSESQRMARKKLILPSGSDIN
jgi:hypothetical protein